MTTSHRGHVYKSNSGWWVWSCQDCSSRSLLHNWHQAITLNNWHQAIALNNTHRRFHNVRI